jgi:non-ribosomal peptide synthetase component E (peptide arylation enzyme)
MFNVRVQLALIGLAEICVPDQVRYLPTLPLVLEQGIYEKKYLRNLS